MSNLLTQTLLPKTLTLINKIQRQNPEFIKSCYLSGGTALSLQLGHRVSLDLDFFSTNQFNPEIYQQQLQSFGSISDVVLDNTGLNLFINKVKVQILYYPYKLLGPVINWNGIQISGVLDIACTKLLTVSQRGSKKDFIDLYFILKKYALDQLFRRLADKYPGTQYNLIHILKSLTYFTDADSQPMPKMLINISWDEVKQNLISAVKSINV